MAKNNVPSINLLKNNKKNLINKIINWTLTIGRGVVVLTELIALSAFLYRFSLDRKLIDLHSQIKQEQAIVNYLKNNEDKYRNLQDRLMLASNFSNSSSNRLKNFKDIWGIAGDDVSITTITLNKKSINLNANLNSTSSLTNFVNLLKQNSNIQTLSLDNIESVPSSTLITVSITAILK